MHFQLREFILSVSNCHLYQLNSTAQTRGNSNCRSGQACFSLFGPGSDCGDRTCELTLWLDPSRNSVAFLEASQRQLAKLSLELGTRKQIKLWDIARKGRGEADLGVMASPTVTLARDAESFKYNGRLITMARFRQFVQSLIKDASDILVKELLFSTPQIFSRVPIAELKDDLPCVTPGFSFLTNPANASILSPGFTNVIANLEAQPDGELLIARTAECYSIEELAALGATDVKKSLNYFAGMSYEVTADKFLELLLVTILVTGGLPPYGESLLHVRLINENGLQRGVVINDELNTVAVITSDGHPTNPKPVPSIMPEQVGQMILLYMADVLPLLRGSGFKENNYLFAKGRGRWSKERYEAILRRETRKRLGVEMGLDGYKAVLLELSKLTSPGFFDADGYAVFCQR